MPDGTSAKTDFVVTNARPGKATKCNANISSSAVLPEGLGPHKQVEGPFSNSLFAHNSLGLR